MIELDDIKHLVRLSLTEMSCSFNKHWLKADCVQDRTQRSKSYKDLVPTVLKGL